MCRSQEKFQKAKDSFPRSFPEGKYIVFSLKFYYLPFAILLVVILFIHIFAMKDVRIDSDIKTMLISIFMLPIVLHIYFYRITKKSFRKIIKILKLCLIIIKKL